ncbi:hypothetical protein HMPREF0766_14090 [Sphingobacterium spiritivorum ATCC 33861]|uniref:Uncharacterized protein n=1 Tax=Sphingobacterium spiritivorum ATCC 33861 TaxID=525373 RepID=D7VSY6_SPHSI|nr:hypothetical protein HMPREF0766_14090 [Sphingobacterium spiritivorum ATCC 33861]
MRDNMECTILTIKIILLQLYKGGTKSRYRGTFWMLLMRIKVLMEFRNMKSLLL